MDFPTRPTTSTFTSLSPTSESFDLARPQTTPTPAARLGPLGATLHQRASYVTNVRAAHEVGGIAPARLLKPTKRQGIVTSNPKSNWTSSVASQLSAKHPGTWGQATTTTPGTAKMAELKIEGLTTGNIIHVNPTEIRQPVEASNGSARRKSPDESELPELLDRMEKRESDKKEKAKSLQTIRKLEAEVKRLKALLEKKEAEIEELKKSLHDLEEATEKENVQAESEISDVKAKLTSKEKEVEMVSKQLREFQASMDRTHQAFQEERKDSQCQEESLNKAITDWNRKLAQLQQKIEEAEQLEAKVEAQAKESEKANRQLLQQLTADVDVEKQTLLQLEKVRDEYRDRDRRSSAELVEVQEKLRDYHQFLAKLCGEPPPTKPTHFTVVDGHALVPLPLLLEGYSYLPQDMRNENTTSEYHPPTAATAAFNEHIKGAN